MSDQNPPTLPEEGQLIRFQAGGEAWVIGTYFSGMEHLVTCWEPVLGIPDTDATREALEMYLAGCKTLQQWREKQTSHPRVAEIAIEQADKALFALRLIALGSWPT